MRRFAFEDQGPANEIREAFHFEPRRLPLSRAKRSRRLRRRLIGAALGSIIFGGALALWRPPNDAPSPESRAGPLAPLPVWTTVANAQPLFGLASPEFALDLKTYEVQLHRTGRGRQDIMVFGDVGGSGPFLRLIVYRVGTEGAPAAAFFVDLARRAAETGRAITFAAQPTALPTRLGMFEAADLNMTRAGAPDATCLGFRSLDAETSPAPLAPTTPADLRISGFACAATKGDAGPALTKEALACLIDKIDLLPSVVDTDLAAFFAARDLRVATACREAISNNALLDNESRRLRPAAP